ncbi:MAG TPA: flagellar motor stator protein MotA [Thermodesulfovibrionales bacterium]|jgi:chemotaxis protein MotA|nr:flagellar motor stator protein MotA [Thermodesulfovibrionales bacterium]
MFAIIGIIVVLGSVIGGFLMEHGNLSVLFQPAEVVIIFGAAIGGFLIASPPKVVSAVFKNIFTVVKSKNLGKTIYLELLSLLFQLFTKIRKEGLISVEADIENPQNSAIFSKYRGVMSNHHAIDFICDNLKVIITTNVPSHELDSLMDIEIETHQKEAMIPSNSVAKIADALPGLGIVAAVLGVVLTMGKIDQPPAVLGHSIGAALVGTFLGVLMCYGFVGPMATNLEHSAEQNSVFFQVIKVALVAFVGGAAPQIAVEFGRRAIPGTAKPSFDELEKEVRSRPK